MRSGSYIVPAMKLGPAENYGVLARAPKGEWQPTPVTPAAVRWDGAVPISEQFDDIYFSKGGGLDETAHVFLHGNDLQNRFQALTAGDVFVVGELGFGTGLNLLATWKLWSDVRPPGARLTYVSFERYPFPAEALAHAHSFYPELSEFSGALRRALPQAVAGFHQLILPDDSFTALLVYGEASEFLPLLEARVDAWFFDGFDPKKNPELWSAELLALAANCSKQNATFATYTVARAVREALSAAGFVHEKSEGFGTKRQMLTGRLSTGQILSGLMSAVGLESRAQSLKTKNVSLRRSASNAVAVIGGGLAGCSAAYSLCRRGFTVTLFESQPQIATGASGNPAAVLMPHLSVKPDFLSRFYLAGYLYSIRLLASLPASILHQCGVLRLTTSKRLENLFDRLSEQQLPLEVAQALPPDEASRAAGIPIATQALAFPLGGWVEPAQFCKALVAACGDTLTLKTSLPVNSLDELLGQRSFGAVVIANATDALALANFSWLPLESVRGQLMRVKSNAVLSKLKAIVCYDGFVIPQFDGLHITGATYQHDCDRTEPDSESNAELLKRLGAWLPETNVGPSDIASARVGFRAMSPDRLPLIGAAPEAEGFEAAYLAANDGRFGDNYPNASIDGLYFSLGHGSRGLLSCPLAGEIIAQSIAGEPVALENDLARAIDPCRFLVRALKRRQ